MLGERVDAGFWMCFLVVCILANLNLVCNYYLAGNNLESEILHLNRSRHRRSGGFVQQLRTDFFDGFYYLL